MTDATLEQLIEDLERYYLINNYRFVRAAIESYVADVLKTAAREARKLAPHVDANVPEDCCACETCDVALKIEKAIRALGHRK